MFQICLMLALSSWSHAAVMVKEIISSDKQIIHSETTYSTSTHSGDLYGAKVLRDLPLYMGERDFNSKERYREVIYPNHFQPILKKVASQRVEAPVEGSELRTIIKQGPDSNRIVLTILGDGYTADQKEKFFQDVQMLMDDMFMGVTFKSFTPFFNIYAVFVPSKDSGITDVVKKDTAFGLYRSPKNSKRGIMPGNTRAIEAALKLAPAAAHYPIIIANDKFYGGLGGRYAITTSSKISGPVVLRHELGHNFSNVGEEYDGGQVYQGANFSKTGSGSWDQWKVSPVNEKHDSTKLFGAYVWQELTKPFEQKFESSEDNALFRVQISSVGWEKEGDVEILLDGSPLELEGAFTIDRSFFVTKPFNLPKGSHTLIVRSQGNKAQHVLAFADGYSFPQTYDFDSGEVKAFNVFNENDRMVGYRPTENMCLMRDMLSKVFCQVDQENIWLQFLNRVSIIDSLTEIDGKVELQTLPVAASDIEIKWFSGSTELSQYQGQTSVPVAKNLKVKVKLTTPEIRKSSPELQEERSL